MACDSWACARRSPRDDNEPAARGGLLRRRRARLDAAVRHTPSVSGEVPVVNAVRVRSASPSSRIVSFGHATGDSTGAPVAIPAGWTSERRHPGGCLERCTFHVQHLAKPWAIRVQPFDLVLPRRPSRIPALAKRWTSARSDPSTRWSCGGIGPPSLRRRADGNYPPSHCSGHRIRDRSRLGDDSCDAAKTSGLRRRSGRRSAHPVLGVS
jgi:hypothetical protein